MQITQLPLGLKLRDDAIFDNFFVGSNEQTVETLKAFISKQPEQFIYCYGELGVGRTHLLQACCHAASEKNETIFYLPLSSYAEFSPVIFEDMEHQRYVCIDDVDAIIGNRVWEEALFHFYNRARANKVSLLVSARHAPQQLPCVLPDLQSRLKWGLVLEIKTLTDEEKIDALKMRAALRGFSLSNDVGNYLIRHYPRHMHDLFAVLETLDQASLAAKRKLTIPFVRSVMRNPVNYANMPASDDHKR
ncbi:MAG: DnaA regulatory inactivator Hda [Gammaproteobacteria bacterium RIFCSPHIGHO2_12_FULL_40_19]|nr:MAG: DnaA regulatory inactivator Hda [Gammaproteobacteria bacterium RIFCSPHIGHO2_12_FULL_40_19]